MKHLFKDYENKKPMSECGKRDLEEKDVTTRFRDVTCPKCQKTAAFKRGASHPFYGVSPPKKGRKKAKKSRGNESPTLEEIERDLFG